jgi:hypothetical protein
MGHGGGQHKKVPGIVARARGFVAECDFAVAAVDVTVLILDDHIL